MNVLQLEPFAMGYMNTDKKSREYKVAAGIKCFAENAPLSIDPSEVFVAPYRSYWEQAISYDRSGGYDIDEAKIEEKVKQYPECAFELHKSAEYFRALETRRVISKIRSAEQEKLEINKCCWATGGGHSNPDYEMILRIGTNGIREKIERFRKIHTDKDEFYDALTITLDALETVAKRYKKIAEEMIPSAEGKDKDTLKKLSSAFENIPQNKPRNIFEAFEMFWLCFAFIDIDSPGLFDYPLGSFYENADEKERYECLEALWECFRRTRSWNLCVGGSDEFGNDKTCALTYDVLKIAREKKYNTPNITMRVHKNTPESLWQAALDTLATGIGMPAIYNDECVCPALEALGIPSSDSHLYCMNGCNQIDIFGKSHMGLEDGEISLIKALEYALFDGEDQYTLEHLGIRTGDATAFDTFDKFMEAFYKQITFFSEYVVTTSNKAQELFAIYAPNPWKSLIVQGCIEKGLDYKNKGPIYGHGQVLLEGIADAVDSVVALKHFIYDEKKYTMAQLLDALKNDFEGYEDLYNDFSSYYKFGNDIDEVDKYYKEITDFVYNFFLTKETFRGGKFGVGCSTFNRAANYGIHCGALPNGKRKFAPLIADSIGPTPGNDKNGPTALLNSVLKSNQYLATSGNVLQMKFSKAQFSTDAGKSTFEALAKTYFSLGGQTLQINVVSRDELIDAKKHPEKYENLIVRVGGFSAKFIQLSPELQDNIIARTEQDI